MLQDHKEVLTRGKRIGWAVGKENRNQTTHDVVNKYF